MKTLKIHISEDDKEEESATSPYKNEIRTENQWMAGKNKCAISGQENNC